MTKEKHKGFPNQMELSINKRENIGEKFDMLPNKL